MKITAREALELGIWEEVALMAGCSPWAINEGMCDSTELEITVDEFIKFIS